MAYAVYGTGGFAREVFPLIEEKWLHGEAMLPGESGGKADIVFVDDAETRPSICNGAPVIDFSTLSSEAHRHRRVVIAIGSGAVRRIVEDKCIEAGLSVTSLRAQTARVLSHVEIEPGAVLCDYVVLTSNIKIGRSFQANLHSYVGHDCVIGDYVTFAPRASCNGNVHIRNNVYVGTGAMIIQGESAEPLVIGEGAVIGMGAVVTKPVAPYSVVAGNPARHIRTLDA